MSQVTLARLRKRKAILNDSTFYVMVGAGALALLIPLGAALWG
jgi:hypothetical protein